MKFLARAATVGVVGVVGVAGFPAAGQAAQVGDLCRIVSDQNAALVTDAGLSYTVYAGGYFRIEGYRDSFYKGHGDGTPTGYVLRWMIDQSTCRP